MNYSVGILYSTSDFLNEIEKKPILAEEFIDTVEKFGISYTSSIIDLAQKCNWIEIDERGYCIVSKKGKIIVDEPDTKVKLRMQLKDIIECDRPSWVLRMSSGRMEVKDYLPSEVYQIFDEAGLFDKWDQKLIDWWDKLALSARSIDTSQKLVIGRAAEANTVEYELSRTDEKPEWISLESNYAGYDILSKVSKGNNSRLRIEVKGTKLSLREASFYLSRFEWEIGESTKNYVIYLWVLKKPIYVIRVPFSEVKKHTPVDQLSGEWKSVKIPYKPFKGQKIQLKDDSKYKSL